ncbi:uncharacterized protein LOC143037517 [Oratosquilla oratoria]|uniref:uncharacterized protein LOC143037517 n=1 Tax=Oratosquilla oratoria TaxID=337810 RepID=UPI003F7629A5
MEWTRDQTLMLIDLYHLHPILWDPLHPEYTNKLKKTDAWKIISDEMQIDRADVEKKMKTLIGQLRREVKKIREKRSDGADETYQSPWFAYKSLSFLLNKFNPHPAYEAGMEIGEQEFTPDIVDTMSMQHSFGAEPMVHVDDVKEEVFDESPSEVRSTQTTPDPFMVHATPEIRLTQPLAEASPQAASAERSTTPTTDMTSQKETNRSTSYTATSSPSGKIFKKRKLDTTDQVMKLALQKLSGMPEQKQNNNDDECNAFGTVVAAQVRRMPDAQQCVAMKLITDVLFMKTVSENRQPNDECTAFGTYVAAQIRKMTNQQQCIAMKIISDAVFMGSMGMLANSSCIY